METLELAVYVMLLCTSVVGLGFIIERGWALRWNRVVPPALVGAIEQISEPSQVHRLSEVCRKYPSLLSDLIMVLIELKDRPRHEVEEVLETLARRKVAQLERGLVVLEIIVGIAPLLGLVGTIIGMMSVFGNIGQTGLTDAARLAHGIALILRATLLGLLIAIPTLIFWSYYTKKVELLALEMETVCLEVIRKITSVS
jgi:biopolymer transport protein ExbB